nr:uncharacterized protein LOC105848782 isoform X2 [Hydra vulgaris]
MITKITLLARYSNIDQDCLEIKIKEWKEADSSANIYFRPKERGNSAELLFVYQAFWQKKLLKKYGNEMLFLDATYKTTRYSLPLFFLVVKTNVDYQIVATFVSESETFESISEALVILKSWNEDLQPLYCMTDYCNAEIRALETIFIGCKVFICDFHREQSWDRWLKKLSSGCSNRKDDILCILRRLAWSKSIDEEENAQRILEQSEFWSQESFTKFKQYIEKYWLPIKKRWVWWYRQDRLLINCNTNNGVERQNKSFKYTYLQRHKNSSLTGMLTLLIDDFFIDKLDSYTDSNFKMDARYRRYARWVPSYLYNRPHSFVKHCLIKKSNVENLDLSGVIMIKHGVFAVLSSTKPATKYFVSFGDEITMPKCTCLNWISTAYPCKHFFLVFRKYPAWSWSALSSLYLRSPFLNLDADDYEASHEKPPFSRPESSILPKKELDVINDWNEKSKKITSVCSGVNVREMLTTIQNLTYEFEENSEEIVLVYSTLASLIKKLEKNRTKESGIPLSPLDIKLPCHLKRNIPIPVRKPMKLPTDRVGNHKDMVIASSKIFLEEKKHKTEPIEVDIIEHIDGNSIIIDDESVTINENDGFEIKRLNHLSPNCNLSSNDLNDILTNQMLSDIVIHTMQKMITGVGGLQDPVLGQNLSFRVQKASFVQVLHDGDAHWLAISNFGCSVGEVFLLDSFFRGKVKNHVVRQICAIMHCNEDKLTVRVVPVQQQTNYVDCGLYALAFIKHITDTRSNPSYVAFDAFQMRNHLLKCVKGNQFTEFPKSETAMRFCKEKEFNFSLYCICRQVWLASDSCIKDRHMVQCGICENWYHRACERIPDYVLEDKCADWSCSKCSSML